jgi:subtilisin family serine protease
MTTYNVALKEGVDYDAFWTEIEANGVGSAYVPSRSVDIVNAIPPSLRQCWYDLTDSEADKLRNDPRVYCVEIPPDFRTDLEMKTLASQTGLYYKVSGVNPSDTAGINWGLFRLNSTTNNTTSTTSGTLNYDYPLDGTGVDFIVQDSGLQIDHPDFQDANGVTRVQQINWYTASGYPGTMPSFASFYQDINGHGTHCCGIAAGKTYGRAKNSRIYVMTLFGLDGYSYGIPPTDAFYTILGWHNNKPVDPATGYKRPTVVNMSWGYNSSFSSLQSVTYRGTTYPTSSRLPQYGMMQSSYAVQVDTINVAVAELLAAGIILVGAAGNSFQICDEVGGLDYNNYWTSTSGVPVFPDNYYMRGGSPVCNPGVIVVGNVDTTYQSGILEQKVTSSNSGPRVDVWAPGQNIVSTVSNTNRFGATANYPGNPSYKICSIGGTSMASPNVAGIAAQLLQVYPTATPAQIRQKIIDTSTANMLYTTGLSTDYSDFRSLHGGPNRFSYQPFNSATSVSVTGSVTLNNVSLS